MNFLLNPVRYGEMVMAELQQASPRPGDSPARFVSWLWRVDRLAPKAVAVPVPASEADLKAE